MAHLLPFVSGTTFFSPDDLPRHIRKRGRSLFYLGTRIFLRNVSSGRRIPRFFVEYLTQHYSDTEEGFV